MLMTEHDDTATERLAVLGSPIAHSQSPAIHAAAYAQLGLAWSYGRDELLPAQLADYLAARDTGWRGFSLTMPLKEQAYRLAAIHDPIASASGVVNTLLRLDSDTQRWAGFNTDVPGLARALEHQALDVRHTVVLGAGATAVSAVLAAQQLGATRVTIAARRIEAAQALAERLGGEAVTLGSAEMQAHQAQATLVISTVPSTAPVSLLLADAWAAVPLFDVVYDPWPSPLAEWWRARDGQAHSGEAMLVEQALLQVRIFVNGDPGSPLEAEERVHGAMRASVGLPSVGG